MRELSKIEIQKVSAGKLIDNQGVVGTTGPLAAGTPPHVVGVTLFIKKARKNRRARSHSGRTLKLT
jgi:hypothetical protein